MKTFGNYTDCWSFGSAVAGIRNLHGRRGFCGDPNEFFTVITFDSSGSFQEKEYVGTPHTGSLSVFDHGTCSLAGDNSISKTTGNITYGISNTASWTTWNEARTSSTDYTYRNGHSDPSGATYPRTSFTIFELTYSGSSTPTDVHTLSGGYNAAPFTFGEGPMEFIGTISLTSASTMSVDGASSTPRTGLAITMAALVQAMKDNAADFGIYGFEVECILEEVTGSVTQTSCRGTHNYYLQRWACWNSGTDLAPVASWEQTKESTWTVSEKLDLSESNSYSAILSDCETSLLGGIGLLGMSSGAGLMAVRDEALPAYLPAADELTESWDGSAYVPHSVTTYTGNISSSAAYVPACRRRTMYLASDTSAADHGLGHATSSKFAEGMALRAITPYDSCDSYGTLVVMEWRKLASESAEDAVQMSNQAKAFDLCAWQTAGKPLCICCTQNSEGAPSLGFNFSKSISKPGDSQWMNIVQHMSYGGYLVDANLLAYSTDPAVNTHCVYE